MATIAQLEAALVGAHKAGDMDAARKLAAILSKVDRKKAVPDSEVPGTQPLKAETTLAEDVVGAGEAALATATGATGGTAGMIAGTLKGLAEQILSGEFGTPQAAQAVQAAAMKGAGAMTYAPRTEAGKDITAAVGDVAAMVPPVLPVAPVLAGASTGAAVPARAAAGAAGRAAKGAAKTVVEKIMPAADESPTPGTMASGGAAAVDAETLRRARAAEAGFTDEAALTKGQATRKFEDQRFEREVAKDPEQGAAVRERFANQNRRIQQTLDSFIDATGAEAPDLRTIGVSVDRAIRDRAAKDKARIRTLYKEAEKSGELQGPTDLSGLADYLNSNRAGRTSAPIMQTIADELQVQGIGGGKLADGTVKIVPGTLSQAEAVRKAINKFAKDSDPNDLRVAREMKDIIDQATEGAGGQKYKAARAARARYSSDYENASLVRNIISNKRGSTDRAIALEDVLNRSIIGNSSLDDVRNIRRLLQTAGENGKQAWRELQGGTLRHIKDEATKNVARNERGDPIVSAAQLDRTINALDKSGKLDFVFGKKGAEQIRTINDVAKDVLTSPPGAVNTSNTASVILAALDIAISGTAGVPAPVLSGIRLAAKGVKNAKTKARVKEALGE